MRYVSGERRGGQSTDLHAVWSDGISVPPNIVGRKLDILYDDLDDMLT